VRIGILGGTGPAGSGLALRLASAGYEVVVGSRSRQRAETITADLLARWPGRELDLTGSDNADAAAGDIVVVATPWEAATIVSAPLAAVLSGKVVVSMANALVKVGEAFQALALPRGSIAAGVQAVLPESMVAAAFHHLPASELAGIDRPMEGDVLVCSDHPAATEAVTATVEKLPNLRALDAGPLSSAAPIESFVAVLLQLNLRYRGHASVRVTGIEP